MGSRCRPKEGGASAAGRGDRGRTGRRPQDGAIAAGDRDCERSVPQGEALYCGISCRRRTQRDAVPARRTVGSNAACAYATRPQPSTHKTQRPASAERRQDPRAVHDSRGPRSEKGPFMARSSRGVFSNGCLRRFSDAWREYLAEAGSFWMHGGDMLPGRGAFPVRGPFGNA